MDLDTELVLLLNRSVIGEKAHNLIEIGANPDVLNASGYSLLHIFIFNRQFAQAFNLVKKLKANINIKDNHGRSPLYYMLEDHYPIDQIINMIKNGADPRTTNREGQAALSLLLKNNFKFVLELIISQPELLHFKDNNGTLLENMLNIRQQTPFTAAEYIGLVRYGANGNISDKQGSSLLTVINEIGTLNEVKEFVVLNKISPHERINYTCKLMGYFIYQELDHLVADLQNNSLTPKEIVYLGRYPTGKEQMIQYIKTLDLEAQIDMVNLCLVEGSPLNDFFSVQRGWFMTSNNRGTLAQLRQMQIELYQRLEKENAAYDGVILMPPEP
ncbi:MAG: ankyrin repeat domain-containing protein [Legionella sp.]|nr:MAG: ankyrin repeat domain-containing protein [Legionella sp.]